MTRHNPPSKSNRHLTPSRVKRGIAGAVVGMVIGAIAAVNVEIYAGASRGYETAPREFFDEHPVAAVIALALIVAGVVIGAWVGVRRSG